MNTGREKTIIAEFIKAFAPDLDKTRRNHHTDELCRQIATERDESKIPALIRAVIAKIRKELKPPKPTETARRKRAALKAYKDWERVKRVAKFYAKFEPTGEFVLLYRRTNKAIAKLSNHATAVYEISTKLLRRHQETRAARLVKKDGYTKQSAAQVIIDEDKAKGITDGYTEDAARQAITKHATALGLPVDRGKRGRKKQNPAGREAPAANEAKATRTNAKRKKPKK